MDPGKNADNIGDFQRYYERFADSDLHSFVATQPKIKNKLRRVETLLHKSLNHNE